MSLSAIIIDQREPDWVKKLTFGGLPTSIAMLDQSDVMAATDDGQMLLVERKTPADFLNSLRDERVLLQLANMLLISRWSYLLVTGEFLRGPDGKVVIDRGETGWSWTSLQGALLTVQEMGVFVSFCAGDTDFEAAILRLGNRDRKPTLELGPAKNTRVLNVSEGIIASLPGIGVERMHQVMDYCGTAGWALVALTDAESNIPGIPVNVKNRVRAALGLKDDQQLGLLVNDQGQEVLQFLELGAQ